MASLLVFLNLVGAHNCARLPNSEKHPHHLTLGQLPYHTNLFFAESS